jgi:hypothetical protein
VNVLPAARPAQVVAADAPPEIHPPPAAVALLAVAVVPDLIPPPLALQQFFQIISLIQSVKQHPG